MLLLRAVVLGPRGRPAQPGPQARPVVAASTSMALALTRWLPPTRAIPQSLLPFRASLSERTPLRQARPESPSGVGRTPRTPARWLSVPGLRPRRKKPSPSAPMPRPTPARRPSLSALVRMAPPRLGRTIKVVSPSVPATTALRLERELEQSGLSPSVPGQVAASPGRRRRRPTQLRLGLWRSPRIPTTSPSDRALPPAGQHGPWLLERRLPLSPTSRLRSDPSVTHRAQRRVSPSGRDRVLRRLHRPPLRVQSPSEPATVQLSMALGLSGRTRWPLGAEVQ